MPIPAPVADDDRYAHDLGVSLCEPEMGSGGWVRLSADGAQCAIDRPRQGEGATEHWFDKLQLATGEYAIVRNGVPERRARPINRTSR